MTFNSSGVMRAMKRIPGRQSMADLRTSDIRATNDSNSAVLVRKTDKIV